MFKKLLFLFASIIIIIVINTLFLGSDTIEKNDSKSIIYSKNSLDDTSNDSGAFGVSQE